MYNVHLHYVPTWSMVDRRQQARRVSEANLWRGFVAAGATAQGWKASPLRLLSVYHFEIRPQLACLQAQSDGRRMSSEILSTDGIH